MLELVHVEDGPFEFRSRARPGSTAWAVARHLAGLLPCGLLALVSWAQAALAADIAASPPRDLSVTIYRSPELGAAQVGQNQSYAGFALITETRDVAIPAGLNRVRFEGVADGIQPASALVSGLPSGVIEKNQDARLLSPETLLAAAAGKPVTLQRTDPRTGKIERQSATIRSASGTGVVFETAAGIESLQCWGVPETFTYDAAGPGLPARPTLSLLTESDHSFRGTVTLSYLALNFDWAADYAATLSPDGRTLDLGGWITLANGNSIGFPDSRAQIVAGKLNWAESEDAASEHDTPVLARCVLNLSPPVKRNLRDVFMSVDAPLVPLAIAVVGQSQRTLAVLAKQEQLGDLKLYRVPDRTTIASREVKQIRLLDRSGVPIERTYTSAVSGEQPFDYRPAELVYRTVNDAAHHLGLPLPAGRIEAFERVAGQSMLFGEARLADSAVGEAVEFKFGPAPDVQVRQVNEIRPRKPGEKQDGDVAPLHPIEGCKPVHYPGYDEVSAADIANARSEPIAFELRVVVPSDNYCLVGADHPLSVKDGRPVFDVTVPENGTVSIHYQWGRR